jgi:hypothetical protein
MFHDNLLCAAVSELPVIHEKDLSYQGADLWLRQRSLALDNLIAAHVE